jgi:hypothetical protein
MEIGDTSLYAVQLFRASGYEHWSNRSAERIAPEDRPRLRPQPTMGHGGKLWAVPAKVGLA